MSDTKPKKKEPPEKRIARLCECLRMLVADAERVHWKFGCADDGTPSDWDEWVDLQNQIIEAKHVLAKENITPI